MEAWREELYHHGISGMHWGVRRWQNPDGSLTPAGRERYLKNRKRFDEDGNYIGEGNITEDEFKAWVANEADRLYSKQHKDYKHSTGWVLDKQEFKNYLDESGIDPNKYSAAELSKMQQQVYKRFLKEAKKNGTQALTARDQEKSDMGDLAYAAKVKSDLTNKKDATSIKNNGNVKISDTKTASVNEKGKTEIKYNKIDDKLANGEYVTIGERVINALIPGFYDVKETISGKTFESVVEDGRKAEEKRKKQIMHEK